MSSELDQRLKQDTAALAAADAKAAEATEKARQEAARGICNQAPPQVLDFLGGLLRKRCIDGVLDVSRGVRDLELALNGDLGSVSSETKHTVETWLKGLGERMQAELNPARGSLPAAKSGPPADNGKPSSVTVPFDLGFLGLKVPGKGTLTVDYSFKPGKVDVNGFFLKLEGRFP